MAPHSSTLAWKIPWTEEPGRLQSMGLEESDTTEQLHFHFSRWCIGEGNGNPLQCSCLENPRDVGAWWAAVYGVAQSWTRLKWLSSSSSSHNNFFFYYDKYLLHKTPLDLKMSHKTETVFCTFFLKICLSLFLGRILFPWVLGIQSLCPLSLCSPECTVFAPSVAGHCWKGMFSIHVLFPRG